MTPTDEAPAANAPQGVPLTPDLSARILRSIVKAIGDDYRLMPIGGTRMDLDVLRPGTTTKDVDLVLVLVTGGRPRVPELADVLAIAAGLPGVVGPATPNKEGSVVRIQVQAPEGRVDVEIIRGKMPGKGGYFVSRPILEAVALLGTDKSGMLEIPLEALAFLKAWAAHDQEKLIRRDGDEDGKHARRKADFERDISKILDAILTKNKTPDAAVLKTLLAACENKERRSAIRNTLQATGWSGP